MFTKHELQELASLSLEKACLVSLFLNVNAKDNPKDGYLVHFKNLSREALSKLDEPRRLSAAQDLKQIEQFLADRPAGMKRGLAIFSCRQRNFWRAYHTAVPFRNQLIIDKYPYIKPLVIMLDMYQRYLVVIVGRESARLLVGNLGEIEEITTLVSREIETNPSRDGGTGDMGALRAQRQMEMSRHLLLKDALSAMEKTLQTEGIKRVLIGGSDKTRGHFKSLLPERLLKNRIVGEFGVDSSASNQEILARCLPTMKDVEHQFERKALEELFHHTAVQGVLGLSDVLTALQQGNVRKLYVLSNRVTAGMVCKTCGALTPERDHPCPYCGSEMERVPYMVDLAIQRAIDQGARVDMLEEAPRLEQAGGIGALLRF